MERESLPPNESRSIPNNDPSSNYPSSNYPTPITPHTVNTPHSEDDDEDLSDTSSAVRSSNRKFPELDGVTMYPNGELGKGTFSVVHKGTVNANGVVYAFKRITKNCSEERILNEARCLRLLGGSSHVV